VAAEAYTKYNKTSLDDYMPDNDLTDDGLDQIEMGENRMINKYSYTTKHVGHAVIFLFVSDVKWPTGRGRPYRNVLQV
jgi:hypothetical protein